MVTCGETLIAICRILFVVSSTASEHVEKPFLWQDPKMSVGISILQVAKHTPRV